MGDGADRQPFDLDHAVALENRDRIKSKHRDSRRHGIDLGTGRRMRGGNEPLSKIKIEVPTTTSIGGEDQS